MFQEMSSDTHTYYKKDLKVSMDTCIALKTEIRPLSFQAMTFARINFISCKQDKDVGALLNKTFK